MWVAAHVHGWAIQLEPAPSDPIILLPDQVNEAMREAFRETFEREGRLVIQTEGMAAILPRGHSPSPLHEIQGVVTAARAEDNVAGVPFRTITVTVARDDIDNGGSGDMSIETTASRSVWKGEWPQPGDSVRGLVWLQARFERVETA